LVCFPGPHTAAVEPRSFRRILALELVQRPSEAGLPSRRSFERVPIYSERRDDIAFDQQFALQDAARIPFRHLKRAELSDGFPVLVITIFLPVRTTSSNSARQFAFSSDALIVLAISGATS